MNKVKVKIVVFGFIPYALDVRRLKNWKSKLFQIQDDIDYFNIEGTSTGENWTFSDSQIEKQLTLNEGFDFVIAITNIPLQQNYFVRRFVGNRICLTFHEVAQLLIKENIPLENLVLRTIYNTSLIYKLNGESMPLSDGIRPYFHDETRNCIFDFNGIKGEIIHSCSRPHLCNACSQKFSNSINYNLPINLISSIENELKTIKKTKYHRIVEFVENKPILAFTISVVIALFVGVLGSVLASFIWIHFFSPPT